MDKASKGLWRGGGRAPRPSLVLRLFEQEVPEIYDSTVVTGVAAARGRPAKRTKIAVQSRQDRDVDSVGACAGGKEVVRPSSPRAARRKDRHHRILRGIRRFATHSLSPGEDQP